MPTTVIGAVLTFYLCCFTQGSQVKAIFCCCGKQFFATNFANVNAALGSFYICEVSHLGIPVAEINAVLRDNQICVASPIEAKSSHLLILQEPFYATNFSNVIAPLGSFYICAVYHLGIPMAETVSVLKQSYLCCFTHIGQVKAIFSCCRRHFHATNFANVNAAFGIFYIGKVCHFEMPATETVAELRDDPVCVASPKEAKS
jgi:hypothetical protein